MLVELEARFEARPGVLVNQVILFLLRQQRAPEQLWTPKLSIWTGQGSILWFSTCLGAVKRGKEGSRAGQESTWGGCIAVPIDGTDGAPDVGLELGNSGIGLVPEVNLVCQLREGGQECLNGSVWTGRNEVLKFIESLIPDFGNVVTHRSGERDNTREDVGTSAPSFPADRAAPVMSGTVWCISIPKAIDPRNRKANPMQTDLLVTLACSRTHTKSPTKSPRVAELSTSPGWPEVPVPRTSTAMTR